MNKEKPVEVIEHCYEGHRTQTRIFARNIRETWCADPKCKFLGKPAAQGVCYSKRLHTETTMSNAYMERVFLIAQLAVMESRQIMEGMTDKKKIAYLEAQHECDWANNTMGLDYLISLRRHISLLELELPAKKVAAIRKEAFIAR